MSSDLEHGLPRFDQMLLRCVGHVVPSDERQEWFRTWHAELWFVRRAGGNRKKATLADLSVGLVRDALWMRTECWRRTFVGTATLCLCSLAGLSLLGMILGLASAGSSTRLITYLGSHAGASLIAGALVAFVSFAISSRGHVAKKSRITRLEKLCRQLFLAMKIAHVLLLAFVLSADMSMPASAQFPNTSDFFQILSFVLLALAGLRWALHDQELRCKQCLCLLTAPARVGKPSRNLLEWNGSEMNCKRGHGLLSVSEMETSWCEASRWIECGEC